MKFTFLSGGTGTPKLLEGFREIIDDTQISVICNIGDDLSWYGLHVSPDLDTLLYMFSDRLDLEKYWGVKDETFNALDTLKGLAEETWFNIGDKDLGLHIFRQQKLENHSLTEVTSMICKEWGIKSTILPVGDDVMRSSIQTDLGTLSFQEFFVKHRWEPEVERVEFIGNKDQYSKEVENTFETSNCIIIGPSNPVTSIGPMLAINQVRKSLQKHKEKVIAISPIVGDRAYSGPSVKLMKAHSIEPSVVGLAEHYSDIISTFVISPQDSHLVSKIEDLGLEPVVLPIMLNTIEDKINLAKSLIEMV